MVCSLLTCFSLSLLLHLVEVRLEDTEDSTQVAYLRPEAACVHLVVQGLEVMGGEEHLDCHRQDHLHSH